MPSATCRRRLFCYDVFDKLCRVLVRPTEAPMRMPISGTYKIKGAGGVPAGRVEQGRVKPGEEVVFLPTNTSANLCVHAHGVHRGDAPFARGLRQPERQRGPEHQGFGQEQHAALVRRDGV